MIDAILGVIGMILYPLFSVIFLVIDGVQAIFYAFAGIGNVGFVGADNGVITSGNSGEAGDTGLIFYLLNHEVVKNILTSILLLALFLVVIFTTMAFLKNIYTAKPKGWKEIIGNSIKGIACFVFLPVCVLLGVWFGNILLNAINGATGAGGATTMGRKLFITCAYNANKYRNGEGDSATAYAETRNLINTYYKDGENIKLEQNKPLSYYADFIDQIYAETEIDINSYKSVGSHYSLHQINYIILVVGGIFILYALGSITGAMIKRLFMILILFVVSPGVCALYPLDEGAAVKSWSGKVKKEVLSTYGAVAGLNIFYSLLPLVDKIDMGGLLIADIVQLFILVVGLTSVKDFTGLISEFAGGSDAFSTGKNVLKDAKDKTVKQAKTAAKWGGVFAKPVAGAAKGVWNIGKAGYRTVENGVLKAKENREHKKEHKKKQKEYEELFSHLDGLNFKDSSGVQKYMKRHPNGIFTSREDAIKEENERVAKEQEKKMEKQKKKEENKQFYEDMKSDAGTFFSPLTGWVKNAAKAVKDSEFGQAVKEEAQNAKVGAKALGKNILKTSGLTKDSEEIYEEFKKSGDAYDKNKKAIKEGEHGQYKNLDEIKKLVVDAANHSDVVHLSSESIKAMKDGFREPFVEMLMKGDVDGGAFRDAMGLTKDSTEADINYVDKFLRTVDNYAKSINSSDDEALKKEYVDALKKYLTGFDTNGNEKLAAAVRDALKATVDVSLDPTKKLELSSQTIKDMTKASSDMMKDIPKAFEKTMDKVIKAFEKKQKKS